VYSVEVNGKHWYSSQVHHPNASVAQIDFQGNSTAGRRDLFDPEIFTEVREGVRIRGCQRGAASSEQGKQGKRWGVSIHM
jgi:hypothetical protein